jgi:hypothetical protein
MVFPPDIERFFQDKDKFCSSVFVTLLFKFILVIKLSLKSSSLIVLFVISVDSIELPNLSAYIDKSAESHPVIFKLFHTKLKS